MQTYRKSTRKNNKDENKILKKKGDKKMKKTKKGWEDKCYICGETFEFDKEQTRFNQDDFLYSVLTTFGSNNPKCDVKKKQERICGGCTSALHYYIKEQLSPYRKQLKNQE